LASQVRPTLFICPERNIQITPRLALNYKKLPFKTVWLHMPDIKPAMQKLGTNPIITPQEPNGLYVIPVLKDETIPGEAKIIQDSFEIIAYLDKTYPDRPALFPEGSKALFDLFDVHVKEKILIRIFPIVIIPMLAYLDERDRIYFREARERWFKTKLEDMMCSTPERRQECLTKAREGFDGLAKIFDRNGKGSHFIMGDKLSKGDLVLIAVFAWIGELDKDAFEQMLTWSDGRWGRLWVASEEWRENKT
jgi:glutathione S-transferase